MKSGSTERSANDDMRAEGPGEAVIYAAVNKRTNKIGTPDFSSLILIGVYNY